MKKLFILLLVTALLVGCAADGQLLSSALERETILPDSFVSDLVGVPMKLASDRRNDEVGRAIWAWEEAEGPAKLLYLELYLPPSDSVALYARASEGANTVIETQSDVQAVANRRATFVLYGDFYLRIVMIGAEQQADKIPVLIDHLAAQLVHTEE